MPGKVSFADENEELKILLYNNKVQLQYYVIVVDLGSSYIDCVLYFICSLYGSFVQSPEISSMVESPSKATTGIKVSNNEKYGEDRNYPMEVIPEEMFQHLIPGDKYHPFHQE